MGELGIKSEADLIKKSGLTQPTVNRILNIPNYNPTYDTLLTLLQALEIPCLNDYLHPIDIKIVIQLKNLDEQRKKIVLDTIYSLKKLS